ncbi:MAG TPA: DegT/DnrJ/EryC1/StrS family aminotransferase [Methylomirabilota bacterium]|nr:DegT/DnrJ/EryC1/StrS family aminotransferase [Methylomirabilota bacterium]
MTDRFPGRPIPHSRPTLAGADQEALADVVASGFIAQGPRVAAFEREIASALGVSGGVATSSGTAALHLALLALDVGEGDEVLLPTYACAALLHAVRAARAVPRLVDCDPATFNVDPEAARKACTPRTRALVVVHSFGLPADLDALSALGVPVIEDVAQAFGARDRDRPVGSVGAAAVLSFYATKLLTTGEGGMLVARDARILAAARDLREYDQKAEDRPRFNYKMTDLQAALGLAQLARFPAFLGRRQALAALYRDRLAHLPLEHPPVRPDRGSVYYRYVVKGREPADRYLAGLMALGVEARRPVFRPLHRYVGAEGFPGAEEAWARAVSLPLYPALTDDEACRVVDAARQVFA